MSLTHSHGLWVVNASMRLQMQEVEISFLSRVAGFSFTDGVRRLAKWRRFETLFFHTERSQMRWLGK